MVRVLSLARRGVHHQPYSFGEETLSPEECCVPHISVSVSSRYLRAAPLRCSRLFALL
jgi:hypothetical protein